MLKSVAGRQVSFSPKQFPARLSRRVGLRIIPGMGGKILCKVEVVVLRNTTPNALHMVSIDGVTYYNGDTAALELGDHTLTWASGNGGVFLSWAISGSISVADVSAESTTLTVTGIGTLTLNLLVCPSDEQITNGMFATGDTTGWDTVLGNVTIITTDVHSGIYACEINSAFPFFGTIRQLFATPIDARCAKSAGLWAKNFSATQPGWAGFYTDVGVGFYSVYISANTSVWTYFDLLPAINQIKALGGLLNELEVSKLFVDSDAIRVDDISLIGTG